MMALGLALAPAANAAFTGATGAATSFATATVTSPSSSTVSATGLCSRVKGALTLTLTVSATGPLPYANFLRVAVTSGTTTTKEQAVADTGQYAVTAPQGSNSVTVTYEIRGVYRPGASPTTAWLSSSAMTGTASC